MVDLRLAGVTFLRCAHLTGDDDGVADTRQVRVKHLVWRLGCALDDGCIDRSGPPDNHAILSSSSKSSCRLCERTLLALEASLPLLGEEVVGLLLPSLVPGHRLELQPLDKLIHIMGLARKFQSLFVDSIVFMLCTPLLSSPPGFCDA